MTTKSSKILLLLLFLILVGIVIFAAWRWDLISEQDYMFRDLQSGPTGEPFIKGPTSPPPQAY